jgi:hypothetical protein
LAKVIIATMSTKEELAPGRLGELILELASLQREDLRTVLEGLGSKEPDGFVEALVGTIPHLPRPQLPAIAEAVGERDFSAIADLVELRARGGPEEKKDAATVVRAIAEADRSIVVSRVRSEVRGSSGLLLEIEPRPRRLLRAAEAAVRDAARNDSERMLADEIADVLRRFAAAHASELEI